MKISPESRTLFTIRLRKEEKNRWMVHAKSRHGLNLSELIRRLVEQDISDTNPRYDPLILENELKKFRNELSGVSRAINSVMARMTGQEIALETRMGIVQQMVLNQIDTLFVTGKLKGDIDIIKQEIADIFGTAFRL